MLKSMTVRATFLAIACAISFSAHAVADAPKKISIPAGDLRQGLLQLSKEYSVELVYQPEAVSPYRTGGVRGTYEAKDAVRLLLKGTPLELRTDPSGAMLIADPRSTGASALSAQANPTDDKREDSKNPPKDRLQLAQATPGPDTGSAQSVEQSDAQKAKQKEEDKRKQELQEIVVTGTYLHDTAPITPVTTITDVQLQDQGYTTLADAIYDLPQNFLGGGASPASSPITGAGGNGSGANFTFATGINLRGLGGSATLVLLNGKRLAPTAQGLTTDISQIPLSVIDRIEIVSDGASSLYGSDAVAGVVNIITKKDFDGVEVGGRSTGISKGKTPNYGGNLTGGVSWDGGGMVASLDYEKDNPLWARNRSFATALPDPYALSVRQDVTHLFASVHQDVSDRLNLSMDAWATHREFGVLDNFFVSPLPTNQYGNADQYGVSPELDFAISSDWTASLIGQWSREQDLFTLDYPPPVSATDNTPNMYQVSYVEPRVDGKLFDLPGGGVRLALGAQVRKEEMDFSQSIAFGGPPSVSGNDLSRRITSAYSELMIPIIGANNALPLTRELRIDVSARYDHYSDVGSTTNPKVGISWSPVDGVQLHGSYAKSFQAPPLFDSSPLSNFAEVGPYVDPQAPGGTSSALYTFIATPLQPETSRSYNFGLTLNPVDRLKIELSYFDVDFTDEIVGLQAEGLCAALPCSLQQQAELGPFFQRNPSLAEVTALLDNPAIPVTNFYANSCFPAGTPTCPAIDPTTVTAIATVGNVNAASTRVRGLDLTPRYTGIDTSIGRFSLDFNASYYLTYRQQVAPASPTFSVDNTIGNPLRFRAKANVGWQRQGWSANARVNFANSYTNPSDSSCPGGCPVSSWTTVDLGLSYKFSSGSAPWMRGDTRFALTVTNLFDRKPPYAFWPLFSGQNFGYDPVNANPFGRTFAVTFTKRFGGGGSR